MEGIFVSYRRDDSQGFAGRLADDLADILGKESVFRDVEIPVGHDFTHVLNRAVSVCDVLIVVIGHNWQGTSKNNQSRLFDSTDWVRAEIESAFKQGIQVLPVLVGGAKMCGASTLPESITGLSKIQAFIMSDRQWDNDVLRLATLIQKQFPKLKKHQASQNVKSQSITPVQIGLKILGRVLNQSIMNDRSTSQFFNYRYNPVTAFIIGLFNFVKKTLGSIVLIVVIYYGIRFFGDHDMLRMLDQVESRLLIGWERFLTILSEYKV